MPYKEQGKRKQGKPLSPREIKALSLLALGLTNIQIAEEMGLQTDTAKNFIWSVKRKLCIQSRVLLGFYAYAHGYASNADIKEAIAKQRRNTGRMREPRKSGEIDEGDVTSK